MVPDDSLICKQLTLVAARLVIRDRQPLLDVARKKHFAALVIRTFGCSSDEGRPEQNAEFVLAAAGRNLSEQNVGHFDKLLGQLMTTFIS